MHPYARCHIGINFFYARVLLREQPGCLQLLYGNEAGAQTVVHVVIVIGDLVGKVGDLRLQARLVFFQKALAKFAQFRRMLGRTMFEYAFARFEGQVQARKRGVLFLQHIHHP